LTKGCVVVMSAHDSSDDSVNVSVSVSVGVSGVGDGGGRDEVVERNVNEDWDWIWNFQWRWGWDWLWKWDWGWGNKQPPNILLLGLENAGKSTLLMKLKTGMILFLMMRERVVRGNEGGLRETSLLYLYSTFTRFSSCSTTNTTSNNRRNSHP
jgi:hypothetical protein